MDEFDQPLQWRSFDEFVKERREARRVQNLDEVEVKSDFKKWFIIGGGVLLAYYLLRGRKK